MAKKTGIPMIDDLPTITGEELQFALEAGNAAVTLKMPITNPEEMKLGISYDDGSVDEIAFTDTPLNRMMFGMKKVFKDEPAKATACQMRMFALMDLLEDPKSKRKLKHWIREDPNDANESHLHEDLLSVAAKVPLNKDAQFQRKRFLSEIDKLNIPTNDDWITP